MAHFIKESSLCACVAQVGQVALGPCRAVRTPRSEMRFRSGHVGIVSVVILRPEAVAKGGCAAARSKKAAGSGKQGL